MRRDIQGSGIVLVGYVHRRIIDEGSGSSKGGVRPDTLWFPVEHPLFSGCKIFTWRKHPLFSGCKISTWRSSVGIECFAAF